MPFPNCLAGTVVLLLTAQPAEAFSCRQRLVSVGDTAYEVRAKCGPPTYEGVYEVTRTPEEGTAVTRAITRWTYDFGSSRLIRILTFEDGRLRRIESGPYGMRKSGQDSKGCRGLVASGSTPYLVVRSCGQPRQVTRRFERRTTVDPKGLQIEETAVVEEWVYDFGPKRLMRFFTFRNGRLVGQRTGSYGLGR
jgi:hypothetical protein